VNSSFGISGAFELHPVTIDPKTTAAQAVRSSGKLLFIEISFKVSAAALPPLPFG